MISYNILSILQWKQSILAQPCNTRPQIQQYERRSCSLATFCQRHGSVQHAGLSSRTRETELRMLSGTVWDRLQCHGLASRNAFGICWPGCTAQSRGQPEEQPATQNYRDLHFVQLTVLSRISMNSTSIHAGGVMDRECLEHLGTHGEDGRHELA